MLEMKEVAHMIEGRLVHVYLTVVECGHVNILFFPIYVSVSDVFYNTFVV